MQKSYPATREPKPKVLLICCYDPRFDAALREFVDGHLNLPPGEVVTIRIAGGLTILAYAKRKPDDFFCFVKQLLFTFKHFKHLEKVVIIAHQDCGYYEEIYESDKPKNQEKVDLVVEARVVADLPPHLKVEAWFASFTGDNPQRIVFEQEQL